MSLEGTRSPDDLLQEAVAGAIFAFIVPILTYMGFEMLHATNASGSSIETIGFVATLQLMGGIPLLLTLIGLAVSATRGGLLGFVGFSLSTVAAGSLISTSPVDGAAQLLLIGVIIHWLGLVGQGPLIRLYLASRSSGL